MTDLDSTVRDYAEHWRAAQPQPPDLEATLDRAVAGRRSRAIPMAAAALAVVAASVVIAVVLGNSGDGAVRQPIAAKSAVGRPVNGGAPLPNPGTGGGPPALEGRVTGRLLQIGGPMLPNGGTPKRALRGLISVYSNAKGTGEPLLQKASGHDGRFTLSLSPGRYFLRGASASYVLDPPPGIPPCTAAAAVRITVGRTVHTNVVCAVP